jgi:hypothetical protein
MRSYVVVMTRGLESSAVSASSATQTVRVIDQAADSGWRVTMIRRGQQLVDLPRLRREAGHEPPVRPVEWPDDP